MWSPPDSRKIPPKNINLLPYSLRLKECIRQGWCVHAWNATLQLWLKPFSAMAALLCSVGYTVWHNLDFIILGSLTLVIGIPILLILGPIIGPIWLVVSTYRHFTSWDTQYAIVIDCSVTEHLALYKTLFDQLPTIDCYAQHDPLMFSHNRLCYGPRRTAEWAAGRLREIGVPCRLQRVRTHKACGFRINLGDYRDGAAGFLERLPLRIELGPNEAPSPGTFMAELL